MDSGACSLFPLSAPILLTFEDVTPNPFQQRFGRLADRDTLSSALAKKARRGILLRQSAPATFTLIDSKEDHHAKP